MHTHTLCANFGLDKHSLGNSMILDHVHLARCTLQWTRVTRWTKFTGVGPALYRFFPGTVTLCPGSKNPRTENLLPGTKNLFLGNQTLSVKNLYLELIKMFYLSCCCGCPTVATEAELGHNRLVAATLKLF